jgi:hypothetical protein
MLGDNSATGNSIVPTIFTPPSWKTQGAWFWWFWLFFIHDENTVKTGKCAQLMILWSIKKDRQISCNGLDIQIQNQLEAKEGRKWQLNGAAAAWYFDGEKMHDDFVLEKSQMQLDGKSLSLTAPGNTPSSFFLDGKDFVTKIKSGETEFEFRARQVDTHAAIGPNYGKTRLPLGMEIEGTRIENFHLSGTKRRGGETKRINGTAYFQKILVAAPPPQWYWGLYHFADGSFFTYMLPYVGRAALSDNMLGSPSLKSPTTPLQQDITFYHAPSGRVFEGKKLKVMPKKIGNDLWSHEISGEGNGWRISATARAYAHSCWKFEKNISVLPARSTFKYNEYPSVLEKFQLRTGAGETITLSNGWGNMENSWGFII